MERTLVLLKPDALQRGLAGRIISRLEARGLKLVGAPGIEFATSGSDDFLVRLGGEYGFEIGRGFELAPALYVDVTEEDTALVYGVSFAKWASPDLVDTI